MNFEFQSICDQGAVRPNNEDSIKFGLANDGKLAWMIIADGMGGHLAGEVASEILVDEIENSFRNLADFEEIDWLCWIEIELNRANNKIFLESKKNIQQKGMGSTAVLVVISNQQCYVGWVGDSRCYLYSEENNLTQLTTDHTMVQALLDKGAITENEAKISNNKNLLSKAMGIKKGVEVDTIKLSIHNQDILLLSTDGLHDNISVDSLGSTVKKVLEGFSIGEKLVEKAIGNGSKDNITFGSIFINNI